MKHISRAIAIGAVLVVSCRVQESREAMSDICRYWDAQKCNAAYGVSSNSDGEKRKTIRITLEEVPLFDSVNALGSVTSVVALQFVSSAGKEALEGFDQIAVKATKGTRFLDDTYLVSDVVLADSLYRTVATFYDLLGQHRISELASWNDDVYFPDSMMTRVISGLVMMDTVAGPLSNPRVFGFQLGKVEGIDLPVVMYRTQVSFGPEESVNVSFQVNQRNGQLSYMGVADF